MSYRNAWVNFSSSVRWQLFKISNGKNLSRNSLDIGQTSKKCCSSSTFWRPCCLQNLQNLLLWSGSVYLPLSTSNVWLDSLSFDNARRCLGLVMSVRYDSLPGSSFRRLRTVFKLRDTFCGQNAGFYTCASLIHFVVFLNLIGIVFKFPA